MAVSLREKYFENDEFLKSITSGEDIMSLNKLKQLAAGLIDEAKKNEFDYEANRILLVELA
jgi:ethanolamine utilization cobalamin adenosyltransferase